jgi:hypothetical protein
VIMMSGGMESVSYLGITHVDYLSMAAALGATRTIEKPFKYSQLIRLGSVPIAAIEFNARV